MLRLTLCGVEMRRQAMLGILMVLGMELCLRLALWQLVIGQ